MKLIVKTKAKRPVSIALPQKWILPQISRRRQPPFAVPRTLTAAISPAISGYLLTLSSSGRLLVIYGALKIIYDLTLLRMFGPLKPPEEADNK